METEEYDPKDIRFTLIIIILIVILVVGLKLHW